MIHHNFNRENQMAGKDWYNGFIKRHRQISLRNPEPTSLARLTAFNKPAVSKFFSSLENLIDRYHFSATSIFNVDETALSTVPSKHGKVLSRRGRHQVGTLTSTERGSTTTGVFCVSAAGRWVPPMLLFRRKRMSDLLSQGAPPGTFIKCNESGWMIKESFVDYLHHFIDSVKPTKEDPVLLILDGHSSHTKNIQAIDLAWLCCRFHPTQRTNCSHSTLLSLDLSSTATVTLLLPGIETTQGRE